VVTPPSPTSSRTTPPTGRPGSPGWGQQTARVHRRFRANLIKVFALSRLIGVSAAVGVVLLRLVPLLTSGSLDVTPGSLLRAGLLAFVIGTIVSFFGVLLLLYIGWLRERGEDARHFARERRQALRRKVWLFRNVVSDKRVRLEVYDLVSAELRVAPPKTSAGFRERRLQRKYALLHARVAGIMESSRDESLETALRLLGGGAPDFATRRDETPSVWHLARQPRNYAVRRLLYEHVPVSRADAWSPSTRFIPGVVATPRWVWELVVRGERAWTTGEDLPGAVGEECVPLEDADMETLRALYEPGSSGPMRSLTEAVFAARTI
jgi:hypothetical protein